METLWTGTLFCCVPAWAKFLSGCCTFQTGLLTTCLNTSPRLCIKKTSPGKPQKPPSQRSVDSDSFSGNTCNCNLFVKLWDVCRIPNQYQNGWRGHFSLQTAPASTPKSQHKHPEKSFVSYFACSPQINHFRMDVAQCTMRRLSS